MFLSRFGVKNYKCLVDIDIPLTPIHVLIGQNDAGKTSLLEAFYGSSKETINSSFHSSRNILFHGSDKLQIELSGVWESAGEGEQSSSHRLEWGFSFVYTKHGQQISNSIITEEHGAIDGHDCQFVPSNLGTGLSKNAIHNPNTSLAVKFNEEMRALLENTQRYALNAKSMATPAALDTNRKFRLDSDGFGLPTLLAELAEFDSKLTESVRKRFLEAFPQFTSIRTETTNGYLREYTKEGLASTSGTGIGKTILFDTASGGTLTGEQVSDGVILVLGFLTLAHTPNPPKLLLIEEPENGIYPQRLQEVIGLLREMTQRTDGVPFPQIIMSTHSPYVLSMFEPEEVTFLSRRPDDPGGGVRARPMRDAPHIRERMAGGEFYLGELWYNLDEEELFGGP